ncbi:hypothetical protein, partial [Enterobacter hormaechei]
FEDIEYANHDASIASVRGEKWGRRPPRPPAYLNTAKKKNPKRNTPHTKKKTHQKFSPFFFKTPPFIKTQKTKTKNIKTQKSPPPPSKKNKKKI